MEDFEGWALASIEKAVARWEEGRIEMFCHHLEMAFSLLEKHYQRLRDDEQDIIW
jgi:hypothetical protein